MLSENEIDRYARHIVLPEIGGAGQQLLKKARVLVIGAGGLGAPNLSYLAAAGVGHITIIDDDTVSLSNLQRQILYTVQDIGIPKAEIAARQLKDMNPEIYIISETSRLTKENAKSLISNHDVICDGCDNFPTRYLVADMAAELGKTLVTAAVNRFDGYITTLKPHEKDEQGKRYPNFRDIFPKAPPDDLIPTCAEAGVLGVLTGILGSMQALETIREITGFGDTLAGHMLLVDAMTLRFEKIKVM